MSPSHGILPCHRPGLPAISNAPTQRKPQTLPLTLNLNAEPPGLSAIANVPNETSAGIFRESGLPMPSLRWSAHAMEVKQKLPKLILYSKYTNETDGTVFYAWAGLQEAVAADCTLAKNCTLE